MKTETTCAPVPVDTLKMILELLKRKEWKLYCRGNGLVPDRYACLECNAYGEDIDERDARVPTCKILTPKIHEAGCKLEASIKAITAVLNEADRQQIAARSWTIHQEMVVTMHEIMHDELMANVESLTVEVRPQQEK